MDDKLLSDAHLRHVMDAMSDMVRVITFEGRVSFTNKAFDKRFSNGVCTVGQRCYEALGLNCRCTGCLAQEACMQDVPQQVIRRHDKRVYSVTVSALKDDDGKQIAMVEVFRDTTLEYNIKQNLLMQNAKMQKDLNLAHNLQQSLVKKVMPSIPGYNLCAAFFPCEAVSGDIYDCIVYGDKFIMYIADVSGHGVMPSMLSVFFSRTVKTACSLGIMRPSEIFHYVQKDFVALGLADSIYITAFIVVVDQGTGEFAYSNAGLSVEPLLYADDKLHILTMGAQPICRWFAHPQFYDARGNFPRPGSRLCLYSDGINGIQAETDAHEELCRLFEQEPFDSNTFINTVKEQMYQVPEDDLTMLICERV